MAAATAAREPKRSEGRLKSYPVAASTEIWAGTLVALNSSGYLVNIAHGTASQAFAGVAIDSVDNNPGSNGDLACRVRRDGEYEFVYNGGDAVQGKMHNVVYALDNQTVDEDASLATNDYPVGKIVEIVSATKVRIDIGGFLDLTQTIVTANLATGVLSADVAGRALMAADYFNAATVLTKFDADSLTTANLDLMIADDALTAAILTDKIVADAVTNAVLLKAVLDGAFLADTATRALFTDGIWTQAKLAAASLDGTIAKVVADANIIGGLTVLHRIDIAAAALGETDVILTHKTRVIDAWLVLRGAGVANTTVKVQNGATTITDAMAASGSDKALVRATTLDDAQWEIAAGGTLRVKTETGATQPAATIYVLGIRVT